MIKYFQASTPITKKPSIDVVDLSDDDTPAPKVHRPAPPLTRQPVPRNPVQQHSIRPRPSFRPQGNQLFNSRGMRPGGVRMGRPTLASQKLAHPAPLPPMPNPQVRSSHLTKSYFYSYPCPTLSPTHLPGSCFPPDQPSRSPGWQTASS